MGIRTFVTFVKLVERVRAAFRENTLKRLLKYDKKLKNKTWIGGRGATNWARF